MSKVLAFAALVALALPQLAEAQAKTFYLVNSTAPSSGFGALQDGGTAPGGATLNTVGWTTARPATVPVASPLDWGVKEAASTFVAVVDPDGTPDNANGDSIRTQNAYSGTFASGTWTLSQSVIATVTNTNTLRLRYRVLASSDPAGVTGLRELTAATLTTGTVANLSTSAQTLSVTWSPGAVTLSSEYLFFQIACEVTARGSNGNTQDILFRTDGTNSRITTPAFTASTPVTSVAVSPTTATIAAGATQTISATANPTNATNRNVSWTLDGGCDASDAVNPASTLGDGTATTTFTAGTTGTLPRTCTVTATAADGSGRSATSAITINPVPVTSVSVNPTAPTVTAGGTQNISATANPSNATNRNVNWALGAGCDASDGVSPGSTLGNGVAATTFTAGTSGTFPRTCAVTATAADGSGRSATSTITVNPALVTSVSVSPTTATVLAGGTQAVSATANPATATNRNVNWTRGAGCDASDSFSPASTVGNGVATTTFTAGTSGTFPRTCALTATAADGSGYSATSSITVNPVLVTGVTVSPPTASLAAGGTQAIAATASPSNATNRNVDWTKGGGCDATDSVSPASTLGDGAATTTFTAGAGGTFPRTCTVTATSADGSGRTASSTITISGVGVSSVTVAPTSAALLAGGTQAITATASPSNAANRNVSWSKGAGCDASDGVSPASTVGDGSATTTFTAGTGGTFPRTCAITATAADGSGKSATSTITVNAVPVSTVSVNPTSATILAGGTQAISATANPPNATNRNVGWTKVSGCDAGDTLSPASTLGNGSATTTFTASTAGTFPRACVVRATAADGSGTYAQSTITVNPIAVTSVSIAPTSQTLNTGTTQQFTATVSPANATNKSVTFSVVQGSSCGTITSGGLYTAPANVASPCTVRVTTSDGNKTADAAITLRKAVTGVAIAPTSASVQVSATQQFTATVSPIDATNKAVSWSVVGTSCGNVSATGLYTAPAAITSPCAVRVTTAEGPFSADATVTLTTAPETTIADGTNPGPATIAPGSAAKALDAFTLRTNVGTDPVGFATVALSAGASEALATVSIQNTELCNQVTPPGSLPATEDTLTIPLNGVTASMSLSTWYVCITPKPHGAFPAPPGRTYAITGRVTSISSANAKTGTDGSSATITVDNKSPANIRWGAVTPGDRQITLNWTPPADSDYAQVVILRNAGAPVVDVPPEGSSLTANSDLTPNARVVCAQASGPCTDSNLTNGVAYYYKAFAKDQYGNYALGIAAGPGYPGANPLPVGSSLATAVAIAIVNPGAGSVVASAGAPFRVQVRAWSPGAAVGSVQVTTDAGATWTEISKLSEYGGDARSGVWGGQLTRGAGSWSVVARAHNSPTGCDPDGTLTPGTTADDCAWVNSAPVGVVVRAATTGDGRLLVRDNASQLCTDCHAMKSHGSEMLGTTYGSWATVCRDCHTPHGTTNVELVGTQVMPPPRGASVPTPKDVVFLNRSALANGSNTGPCQVCHTQTTYYRADGNDPGGPHETGNDCKKCHTHTQGLAATCTDCHGLKDRAKAPGVIGAVDTHLAAAPPKDVDGTTDPTNDAVKIGAHLAHVNQATYRDDALLCADCHGTNPSHQGATEAGWSELARSGGTVVATPSAFDAAWEAGASPSCTNYCHGATLSGGTKTAPDWKLGYTAPGTQATCGTCHGKPPSVTPVNGEDHPFNTACDKCHGVLYSAGATPTVDKGRHIDGAVYAPKGCTACHGVLAGPPPSAEVASGDATAAPGYNALAVDTHGNTAPSFAGVGAHGVHLRPSTSQGFMAAQSCPLCHGQLPPSLDTNHANGTTGFGWSAPATQQNVSPLYQGGSCTNYCHSDAKPLGNAAASTVSVSWTDETNMTCVSCHGDGASGKALSALHAKHLGAPYAYTCDECHANVIQNDSRASLLNASLHVNGAKDWQFSSTFKATAIDQSAGTYAGYTCAGTYCHSPGTKTSGFDAPVGPGLSWNGGGQSGACDNCHGGNAAATRKLATGSHGGHVNNAVLATQYGCVTCHSATVTGDRAFAASAPHVNGAKEVSAASWNGTTCASSSCHSNGKGTYVSATWGSGTLDCNGCHGRSKAFGFPDYPNDGVDVLTANSHEKHIGAEPVVCATCHMDTTADGVVVTSLHANGAINVRMDPLKAGAGASYSPRVGTNSPTCTNVSCHSNNVVPIKWGATLAEAPCSQCHMTTGTGNQDSDDWVADGFPSMIDGDDWARTGHGRATAFTDAGQSGNAAPNFVTNATVEGCFYCHLSKDPLYTGAATSTHNDPNNPARLANTDWNGQGKNGVCLVCHAVTGATGWDPDAGGNVFTSNKLAAKRIGAYHYGAGHSGAQGGAFCWDCHDVHGDYNYGTSRPIAYMIHLEPTRDHSGPTGWGIPTATGAAVDFSSVLGDNASAFDGGDYASASGSNGVCQVCHSTTIYWRLDNTRKNHFAGGTRCTSCHAHNQPTVNAFKQVDNATCGGCHPSKPGGKHASHVAGTVSTTYGTTNVLSTDTVYSYDCGKCHPRATTSHYNDVGGTSGDPYRGEVSFDDGTGTYPAFVTATASETGSGTPTMYFGWQNGACGTTECHDPTPSYPTGAGSKIAVTWTMTTPTLGCVGCHDDANGQATTYLPYAHPKHTTNVAGSYNYGCEKCHANTVASNAAFATGAGKGKTLHANGSRNDVKFNATPRDQSTSGTFSGSPSGTCTNTYCHSGGVNTSGTFSPTASAAIAWNSGTASCRACHGWDAATTPTIGVASGSLFQGSATHGPHVQNTLTGNYACAECHASVVNSGNSPISDTTKHVDGFKDVAFLTKNGQTSGSYVSPTCASNYCHSNGRDPGYTDANRYPSPAPTWGGAAITCTGCHGRGGGNNTTGAPDYGNVPGNVAGANAHAKHTGSPAYSAGSTCQNCHAGYVNASGSAIAGSKHTDGYRDVAILAAYDSDTNATNNYVASPSKTCSNVKCHADGKATLGYKSVGWNDVVGCTGCHSNRGTDQGGVATDLSAKHGKHVNGGASAYAYTCDECHATTMQDNSSTALNATTGATYHVNGTRDWKFSSTALPQSVNQSAGSYNGSTCSGTYCHSRGTSTTAFVAPFVDVAWGGTAGCETCHAGGAGATNKMAGDHGAHMNQLSYLGTNIPCFRCHSTTMSSSSDTALNAATGTTNHVDGTRTVSMVNSDGTTTGAGSYAPKNCSNVYCHSNGTETPDYKAQIAWDGGVTLAQDCTGCHGSESGQTLGLWGAPNYAERVQTSDDVRNSHAKHLSATLATAKTQCVDCHDATIDATGALKNGGTHLDKQVQITVGGKIGSYAPTNEVCNNITCHGGSGTTANWGGTIACLGCHSGADTVLSNGVPNGAGTYWTVNGHGSAAGGSFTSAQGGCDYCHDLGSDHTPAATSNPYRLRYSATDNTLCLKCHLTNDAGINVNSAGTALTLENSAKNVDATHNGTRHQALEGGQFCWDCHDPHGVLTNIKMIKRQVQKTSDSYGVPGTQVAVQFTTQNCTAPAVGCNVESTNNPRQGICQACHDSGKGTDLALGSVKYWRSDGSWAAGYTEHNNTKACSSCHAHKDKFAGKGGGWDCYGCHSGSQGNRRALSADFTKHSHHVRTNVGVFTANSTTEAGGRGTNRDCVVCHSEGQIILTWSQDCPSGTTGLTAASFPTTCTNPAFHANQIIDLRDVDVAAPGVDTAGTNTSFTYNKDRVATSAGTAANWSSTNQAWREWTSGVDEAGGETLPAKAGVDKFCLNCHDAGGAAQINTFKVNSGTAPETLRTAADPFWDGTTNITNVYDTVSRGAVVDIKSKVSCLDGTGAVNLSLCTSNGTAPGQPAQGVFSRHAIRGQSTSRYTTANYIPTAAWTSTQWNDRAVMGCADCHSTDGANTTDGNAHGSNVEYLLKNNAGLAPPEATTEIYSDYVCYRCHTASLYNTGPNHIGGMNGSDYADSRHLTGYGGTAGSSGRNSGDAHIMGMACANCHGGYGWGSIHGTSDSFRINDGSAAPTTRNAYRFMNGGSLRYFDPSGWTGGTAQCYTLVPRSTDTFEWGSCSAHGAGGSGKTGTRDQPTGGRPISY